MAEITDKAESDDPELAKGYPDWIISRKFLTWKSLLMLQDSEIVSGLSKAPLVFPDGTHLRKPALDDYLTPIGCDWLAGD